jgi:hypothetical protein
MLAIYLLPIAIWTGRNYQVFHKLIFLSSKGGVFFYSSWNPPRGKVFGMNPDDEVTRAASRIPSEVERERFYYRKTIDSIVADPKRAANLLLLKNLYLWSFFDWETLGPGRYNFSFVFILPFILFGMFQALRARKRVMLPFGILLGYYIVLSNVFMGIPRYRIQIEPFLIIAAAYGMVTLYARSSRPRIFCAIVSLWLIGNFLFFANSAIVKEACRAGAVALGIW